MHVPEALSPGSRLTQRQGKAAMQEYAKGAGKGLKARGGFKAGALSPGSRLTQARLRCTFQRLSPQAPA